MSDHGFTDYRYKVHVNRWLLENDYLAVQAGKTEASLASVDWSKTKAYAIGLNSLYINLQGREGQGIVPVEQVEQLATEIKDQLLNWTGPGRPACFQQRIPAPRSFQRPVAAPRPGPEPGLLRRVPRLV